MNISLLIHTFNQYEHFWDGFLAGFHQNVFYDMPCYLGTDTKEHGNHELGDVKMLYSGLGEWSDRLKSLVTQIDTDYVLYIQEDMWPCDYPPDLEILTKIVEQKNLFRLHIAPVNQFYSLYGHKIPLFFHQTSKYLVSHQPSIWRKDFLLQCLEVGETPWVNEYEATKRIGKRTDIQGKIAIYPCNWFKHVGFKGQIMIT